MKVLLFLFFFITSCTTLEYASPSFIDIGKIIGDFISSNPKPIPKPQPQPKPEKPKDPIKDQDPTIEIATINAINHARMAKGLTIFKVDDRLSCGAQIHAEDIGPSKICGHTGSDGSNPTERLARCDFRGAWGEIVACGQKSPEEAVDAWDHSPGHAAIMYSDKYTHIGAYMINNYWVAVFR